MPCRKLKVIWEIGVKKAIDTDKRIERGNP